MLESISGTTGNLESLRDQHEDIRESLRSEAAQLSRLSEVKRTVDELDLGVNEGRLMLTIVNYLDTFEMEQIETSRELEKIKGENDWLRDDLEEAEKKLEEVLSMIAALEVEKDQHLLMEEVNKILSLVVFILLQDHVL